MTVWQRFRLWRQSRPFWGGLFAVLSGLEFILSMNLELEGGTISLGQEGFPQYLLAFLMIVCGALAWYLPTHRHLYGLIATFAAVYSLLGLNLGGYFVGMLLGVAGGGLIFAWNPVSDAEIEAAQDGEDEASETEEEVGDPDPKAPSLRNGVPSPRQAADDDNLPKGLPPSPRHAALLVLVVALVVSLLTATSGPGTASAAMAPCLSPTPSPSSTGPGGIIGDIIDWFEDLFGKKKPTPTPTPTVTLSPCPSPSKTVKPSGTAVPTASGTATPPSGTPLPTGSSGSGPVKVIKAAPGQPPVGKKPSRMTGTRVQMINLVFVGVVDLPTADGTIRVLKFSMSQSDTDNFKLHVYGNAGKDTDLLSSKLTVKGDTVYFYTNRFRANLFGLIPVDYTPESLPPPIPLPWVFFTNPDVQLVWVDSPVLLAPNLRIKQVAS
ncbi:DUF6114 domain-containing protein [Catelliglobosispora koreensis]|uniref:DUF6114 domain-containing protein n=1 Tax=Catelliglobosispora koreensis TaxID=129052 RepID=UPI0003738B3C|nr:DUF6114 domain-containing protein [Catelliglobosispora koreensis]